MTEYLDCMNIEKTHFILVRHGETAANENDYVGGSTDDPLTETGHEQARKVGAYLRTKAADAVAVYASPLTRAWETASYIGASLGISPEKLAPLAEWDAGDWEGMKYSEVSRQESFSLEALRDPGFCPPGGEALGEVQVRVVQIFREIARRHPGEQVVVVSHGSALALALAELIDDTMGAWMQYRLANCSVSELMLGAESELIYFNETGHL